MIELWESDIVEKWQKNDSSYNESGKSGGLSFRRFSPSNHQKLLQDKIFDLF